jgi:hypothetical protein
MLAKRFCVTKKFREHKALASRIKRFGFKMFLCFSYKKNNTKCVVSNKENSSCCLECVLRKVKYNAKGILVSE